MVSDEIKFSTCKCSVAISVAGLKRALADLFRQRTAAREEGAKEQ